LRLGTQIKSDGVYNLIGHAPFGQAPSDQEGRDALAAFVKKALVKYIDGRKDALLRRVIPEVLALTKRVADLEKASPAQE